MFRKFQLKSITPHSSQTLEFEWDAEAGLFRGSGAAEVEGLIAHAMREGVVISHPYPSPYEITDPRHKAADLAVVLGQFWILSRELARVHPEPPPDNTPPGGLN